MAAETRPFCLLFSFQLAGKAQGLLRVVQRDTHDDERLLWTLEADMGPIWMEGRAIVPTSPKDFQVDVPNLTDSRRQSAEEMAFYFYCN